MERSQKQKRMISISDHKTCITDLPDQILITIFSRLPARSVLACKFLCRSFFYVTTQDKAFRTLHYDKSHMALLIQFFDHYFLSKSLNLFHPELDLSCGFGVLTNMTPRLNMPGQNSGFIVMNSCYGLVCLKEKSTGDPRVVCNPLTAEYVILPSVRTVKNGSTIGCGLGFCCNTKTLKVMRIIRIIGGGSKLFAEVLSLGSTSWRPIGRAPFSPSETANLVSLYGNLHWICDNDCFVASFNFESESFKEISPPIEFGNSHVRRKRRMTLGVLHGSLVISDAIRKGQFEMWEMREYGNRHSWIKFLAFKISVPRAALQGIQWPLTCLDDGEVVMVADDNIIFSYNPENGNTRFFKFRGIHTQFRAISYTPSFVSLADSIGDKVEVLNLKQLFARHEEERIHDAVLVEYHWASATQRRELPKSFFDISVANIIKEWESL